MKTFLCFLVLAASAIGFAQTPVKTENKIVRKIHISHADPQLIALLLSGKLNFNLAPEITHAPKR